MTKPKLANNKGQLGSSLLQQIKIIKKSILKKSAENQDTLKLHTNKQYQSKRSERVQMCQWQMWSEFNVFLSFGSAKKKKYV